MVTLWQLFEYFDYKIVKLPGIAGSMGFVPTICCDSRGTLHHPNFPDGCFDVLRRMTRLSDSLNKRISHPELTQKSYSANFYDVFALESLIAYNCQMPPNVGRNRKFRSSEPLWSGPWQAAEISS
jgi:hypothetical protein